ncbi:MAG: hypothetical protein FJ267_10475, partial [Planctomycetes bacterium]|nr:hypothetical protein [Planctomycetota bacterium]
MGSCAHPTKQECWITLSCDGTHIMSNRIRISMQSLLTVAMSVAICRAEVRIKDITTIEGDRPNQLTGVGLVVGLNGTGAKSASTQQAVIDMLRKFDVTTKIARQSQEDNVYQSKNIAMVIVTADLPAFARKGSRIDVAVSIVDDATSLEGGTLLMTPLRGADGATYAVASGANSIGGFRVRQSGTGGQQNHPTVSRIPRGATVEREELGHIDLGGFV